MLCSPRTASGKSCLASQPPTSVLAAERDGIGETGSGPTAPGIDELPRTRRHLIAWRSLAHCQLLRLSDLFEILTQSQEAFA